ncbi:cell wall-binding repeat-containing protein [Cytobacillus firmus]|nr:cell wall-binding repeat-containing protein [Cytobacillus firmus]
MKLSKLISSFTAAALVGLTIASTSAFSESNPPLDKEQKRLQIINQLEQRNTTESVIASSLQEQTSAEIQYNEYIDAYEIHEYSFSTDGGNFSWDLVPQKDVDIFIYGYDNDELIDPAEYSSFELPAGDYAIVAMGLSEHPAEYDFWLEGEFSGVPDNTLPELIIHNPVDHEFRLSKGSSPILKVSGETRNSDYVRIYSNLREYEVYPGPFHEEIELGKGFNTVSFYAVNSGGNSITSFYNITHPGVSRIYGKDRYYVSGNVSSTLDYWGYNSGTIIITRGDLFPDALSGGPLASFEAAPIMLTQTNKLPDKIKDKIADYGAERAIILGGTGSVSTQVESQLRQLGVNDIERIGGKDRYVVSSSVAEQVSSYMESDTAIIASGEVFPDALSASTIAGIAGMPILLVKSQEIPSSIQTFIKSHPEITNFIIVGGPATVKDSVSLKLKELRKGSSVQRIGGKDRYEVSINVARHAMENYGMDLSTIAFARGDLFPDALSGAPLANFFYAPILLTRTDRVEDKVNIFLTSNRSQLEHMYLIGDVGSISPNTETQLYNLIR